MSLYPILLDDNISLYPILLERKMKLLKVSPVLWVICLIGALLNEIGNSIAQEHREKFQDYLDIRSIS